MSFQESAGGPGEWVRDGHFFCELVTVFNAFKSDGNSRFISRCPEISTFGSDIYEAKKRFIGQVGLRVHRILLAPESFLFTSPALFFLVISREGRLHLQLPLRRVGIPFRKEAPGRLHIPKDVAARPKPSCARGHMT